jgi:hypothetical protein
MSDRRVLPRSTAASGIVACLTLLLPTSASAQMISPSEVRAEAVPIMASVMHYLIADRDSIPEIGRPAPRALLSRSPGVVLLTVSASPASAYLYPGIEGTLAQTAEALNTALEEMGIAVRTATETTIAVSDPVVPRTTAFVSRSIDGQLAADCALALGRGVGPASTECTFDEGVALLIRVRHPEPRGDFVAVPVDVYSAQRRPNGIQEQSHFSVRLTRVQDGWQVVSVGAQALISPGRHE